MVSKDTRQENTVWLIVRVIISIIAVIFVMAIITGDRSNCGIDRETLACRWTGSAMDILGTVIFFAGLIWLSGLADVVSNKLFKKDAYVAEGERTTYNGLIGVIGPAIGVLLIWIN